MGAFGVGAPLLLQFVNDRPLEPVWLLASLFVAAGSASFGSHGPLFLWAVFDQGRAPRVAVRDESLIETIVRPDNSDSLDSVNAEVLQKLIDGRRMVLPTGIATQSAIAGSGCFLIAAGILIGVEWYSLIAFPFFTLVSAVTLPGQLAALGRAEVVADAMTGANGL